MVDTLAAVRLIAAIFYKLAQTLGLPCKVGMVSMIGNLYQEAWWVLMACSVARLEGLGVELAKSESIDAYSESRHIAYFLDKSIAAWAFRAYRNGVFVTLGQLIFTLGQFLAGHNLVFSLSALSSRKQPLVKKVKL